MQKTSSNFSELKYPKKPGYKEHSTSKQAAEEITVRSRQLRKKTLEVIKRKGSYGATPEEVSEIMNESILSIRPRFTELKINGDIVNSGNKRINGFKKQTIVWRYNDRK